jgi:two-component system, chemotaxis family, protein-glutamate methylesterase/glutaminase
LDQADPSAEAAATGEHTEAQRDVVVVGASAGGVEALQELVARLPPELPAAVLVVLHVLPTGTSVLPEILDRAGPLQAAAASDGERFERGCIYVAPPDSHMLVENGRIRLTHGPRENGHRPAVDPLFRSAARAHRERVIGAVLSGSLDDGTDGLRAIRDRGGFALAQDPAEALYPGMPASAIENGAVDRVVPIAEMAGAICSLIEAPVRLEPVGTVFDHPAEPDRSDQDSTQGEPTGLTCPDCGGALWFDEGRDFGRFRCHVGHAFSPASLETAQSDALESALWAALRTLQERADLYRRMGRRVRQSAPVTRLEEKAMACEEHAGVLREVVMAIGRTSGGAAEDEERLAR